jgi:hypothetical protein
VRAGTFQSVDPPRPQGAVFGFDVNSPFAFDTLREPTGAEPLEIVAQPLKGAQARHRLIAEVDQPDFLARIYHDGATYRLWVRGVGRFDIDPRIPRVAVPSTATSVEREELLWGVPALLCFLHRGDSSLHAAAIEVAGEAIVFVAPHAQGKSTLAAAFARRGYRILSEDLTCIRFEPRPSVIPGPAGLRLRNDVAREVEVAFGRPLSGGPDRTRYALANRGDCRPVPIRALVFLRRSDDDIWLEQLQPIRSLPHLWDSSFRIARAHERRCFESITELANELPILNLHRPLRTDALDSTVDRVLEELYGRTKIGLADAPAAIGDDDERRHSARTIPVLGSASTGASSL